MKQKPRRTDELFFSKDLAIEVLILGEVPITAKFLEVTPLNWKTVVGLLVLSFVIIGVFEIYKLIYKKVYSSKKEL